MENQLCSEQIDFLVLICYIQATLGGLLHLFIDHQATSQGRFIDHSQLLVLPSVRAMRSVGCVLH